MEAMDAMDAARGQGDLPPGTADRLAGAPEPLSAAHRAAEENCEPNGNGDTELGEGAPPRKRLKKVPKPGMYPAGFSPYVMRPPKAPDLKPTKHIARLARPEILQDLTTLRRLCGELFQDTCIAAVRPTGGATAFKAPSLDVLTSPSPTDVSVFSFAACGLGRSPVSSAGSGLGGLTADAGKESRGRPPKAQGAPREERGVNAAWGVGMGTGRGGRAIKTPKRFLDHVSVQDARKQVQTV